jgi:cell filamentation protein
MVELANIHAILFAEIYPWAGKLRTVPLFKGATQFAESSRIPGFVDQPMPQFQQAATAKSADVPCFLAELWGRLNWLHPFPEGHGRATQIFITAAARQHGRNIDWPAISRIAELDAARASVTQDSLPYRRWLLTALRDRINDPTPTAPRPLIGR